MQHRPRKRFGQNFLQSDFVIDRILQAIDPKPNDNMIEIGPGLGALTKPLLSHVRRLIAVEIDRDLQDALGQLADKNEQLTIIPADALTLHYSEFGERLRVVGNLPYNISTPLILHLLHYAKRIEDMHFMLQKEVVTRLAAGPGGKDYGRLSIMVQYFCEVEALFTVPPDAFYPPPKVDSAIVRLIPYQKSPYASIDVGCFEKFVAKAFSMRRKTLANNLKHLITAEQLKAIDIDPTLRPEQITIEEYVAIVKTYVKP